MDKDRSLNMIIASEYPHLKKEGQEKILKSFIDTSDSQNNAVADQKTIENDRARLRSILGMKQAPIQGNAK